MYAFITGAASGVWSFIPIFLLDMKGTVIQVGLLSSLPMLARTIMQMSWGRLCDETGESKRLMFVGYVLTIIFAIPTILSTEPWQVILFMTLEALFSSIGGVASSVFLAYLISSRIRARFMSTYNPINWVGYMVGVLVAGFVIAKYGYIPALSGYIILNIFIVTFLKFFMEEANNRKEEISYGAMFKRGFLGIFSPYKRMLSLIKEGNAFIRWSLGISLRAFGLSCVGPVLTVYMVRYLGATTPQIGTLNAVASLVRIIMMPFLGWIADVKSRKYVFVSGVALAMFYPLIYIGSKNINQLYFAFIINGLFWSCLNATWFAWEMDLIPRKQGEFLGLGGFINGVAWTIGPLVGGFLGEVDIWLNIIVSIAFITAGFVTLMATPESYKEE